MRSLSRPAISTTRQCRFASSAAAADGLEQKPNRLTFYFGKMKESCPETIKAYAVCVREANESEDKDLTRGSCQEEFSAVKACFRQQRREFNY